MSIITGIITVLVVLVILYLLAIMPRMTGRPDRTPYLGVYYAHRGLHDNESEAPENSMAAFQKAVDAGFGIEMDVQLTRDKVPVVFHDFTLKRVCGRSGKISDYSFEELSRLFLCRSKEKIPKLEDFLKLVDGRVPLIVELKVEWTDLSVCPLADELLSAYKGVYCMESFNPLALLWYRRHHKSVMRGQLSDAFLQEEGMKGILYFGLEHLLLNFVTKPDFIAYNHKHYRNLSRLICRKLYKNLAVAYTMKSEKELRERQNDFDLFIFDSFVPGENMEKG